MPSKVYSPTDWRISTYTPEAGSFVLDFSQLNSSDVLGTGPVTLTTVPYKVTSITINEGGTPDNGIFLPLSPSNLSVEFLVQNFTLSVMNNFLVGTPILVTCKFPTDAALQTNQAQMFSGIIESASVDIEPSSDFATISIQASANSKNALNAQLGITRNETDLKGDLIQTQANLQFISVNCESGLYNFKGTSREVRTLGDWLQDLATCDLMQFTDYPRAYRNDLVSPGVYSLRYNLWPDLRVKKNTSTSSGTLNGNDISAVELDWSGAGAPTGVTLTNSIDSNIVSQYGSTQADGGGSFAYSATVDLKDITQMTAVGQEMLKMVKKFHPVSITVPIATNYQTVNYRATITTGDATLTSYIYPENLYFLGETITVDLPDNGINSQNMIITGRTMNITPDNWTATYNLWKGFTN